MMGIIIGVILAFIVVGIIYAYLSRYFEECPCCKGRGVCK